MSFEDAAETLYGDSAGDETATPPEETVDAAERLYGATAPENLEDDQATDESGLYNLSTPYEKAVDLTDAIGEFGEEALDEEFVQEKRAEFHQAFHDLNLSPTEASDGMALAMQYNQAPADDATVGDWEQQTWAQVKQTYGSQASTVLEAARGMVSSDPQLADTLHRTGLGSHPDVVMKLMEKAASRIAEGRS